MPTGDRGHLFIGDFDLSFSDRIDNLELVDGAVPKYVTPIVGSLCKDAEMSFEGTLNMPLFEQMCGFEQAIRNVRVDNMTLSFESPYLIQARKHRKKRINKKWAKRYGFKYMFKVVEMEDVEIENNNDEIDILGRTERRIVR